MVRFTLRLPEELHEKLRWLSYTEKRSQHEIMLQILQRALAKVTVPKEVEG